MADKVEYDHAPRRTLEAFLDANRCPDCGEQPAWLHGCIDEELVLECPRVHRYGVETLS